MKPKLPKIYFIRHGETDWNAQGLIQGSANIELNAKGVGQAEAVAKALRDKEAELRDFHFAVSPQARAQHTMRLICEAQPRAFASVQTDRRLRELEFGIFEGHSIKNLHEAPDYPKDQVGHYHWRPQGGESYHDGVLRVDEFLRDQTKPSLIVAHGAVGRCIIGYVCNIPRIDITHLPTPQGCYCVLENGAFQWFDPAHRPFFPPKHQPHK